MSVHLLLRIYHLFKAPPGRCCFNNSSTTTALTELCNHGTSTEASLAPPVMVTGHLVTVPYVDGY